MDRNSNHPTDKAPDYPVPVPQAVSQATPDKATAPRSRRRQTTKSNSLVESRAESRFPDRERLLKVREFSDLTAISERKVYGMLATGEIQRVKIGRCTRIRISDAMRIIEQGAH